MERTEEQRCRVLWLIGLSSSSLSKEAKLRAFRNLGRARGEVRERIRGERLGKKRNMGNKWEKMFGKRTERGNFFCCRTPSEQRQQKTFCLHCLRFKVINELFF